MTVAEMVQLISAASGLLTAVFAGAAALLSAWAAFASRSNSLMIKEVAKTVDEIHTQTNSITTQLVKATGDAAFSEGVLAEKTNQGNPASPPRDDAPGNLPFVRRRS